MGTAGQIVILNGAPRSGKTVIANAVQATVPGLWVNLGVDVAIDWTPQQLRPGIGLRPGGERPDLQDAVVLLYAGLYESIAAHCRLGLNVVVDVCHHESYSKPLEIVTDCARRLAGLPVLWIGVRCPIEIIWQRRAQTWDQHFETATPQTRAAVDRWQHEVHRHWPYDLEIDTSTMEPTECAQLIGTRLADGPPGKAFGVTMRTIGSLAPVPLAPQGRPGGPLPGRRLSCDHRGHRSGADLRRLSRCFSRDVRQTDLRRPHPTA